MTIAPARPRLLTCTDQCAVGPRQRDHHDRLLALDSDPDVLLELFEIAVTWHELDYSETGVLGPDQWLRFAETHSWRDQDRALRAVSLAVDVAYRHGRDQLSTAPLAEVIEFVRGGRPAYV